MKIRVEAFALFVAGGVAASLLVPSCAQPGRHDSNESTASIYADPHFFGQYRLIVGVVIRAEAEGDTPDGGFKSWDEKWCNQIRYLRKKDAPPEYVNFIIEGRRKHRLPEIRGL